MMQVLIDIFVAIAPVAAYWFQLNLIRKQQSVGAFSIDVCAILLISNILRIFFWFSNGYSLNLLFQALLVISIQIVLLNDCMKLIPTTRHEPQRFWRWKQFDKYIRFLLGMTAVVTVLTVLFQVVIKLPAYGVVLGIVSLSIEACLGFPQLISNFRTKNVRGLSYFMIFNWFVGDLFKTIYFVATKQPFQFTMCGAVQITVDCLIVIQILRYDKTKIKYDIMEETTQISGGTTERELATNDA